jgi:hypothetical protein
MIRPRSLASWRAALILASVALSAPTSGQVTSGADTIARHERSSYSVAAMLATAHVASVDEALSPERYGGSGSALGIRVTREAGARRVSVDAGINMSSALRTARTAHGLPDMRFVAYDGRVDLQRRLPALRTAGVSVLAGVALDGRYAQRTHHLAVPDDASAAPPENMGQDIILTLQPTIELGRSIGSGAIAWRFGVGAIGAVLHSWAPIGSLRQPVKVQTPPALLQFDNLIAAELPVRPYATLGVAYRMRLLRARSPITLTESRNDLALSVGWRQRSSR